MNTKTWKIGEYAQGGIITVEITGKVIAIIGKKWDFSKGSRRSSDQSGAKEFTRGTIDSTDDGSYIKILDYLCELTTSYYSEEIMKWIKTKIPIESRFF